MTMEFRITDAVSLEQLKAGDKLKFDADILGGVLTLIRVEPVLTR
jgi:Cu/Ag efflux protein CusF